MEQKMTTASSDEGGKQKKMNGFKIATVVASVVAVCGIGFGIYGMVRAAQNDVEIGNVTVRIEDDNGGVTTVEDAEVEMTDGGEAVVTISDVNAGGEYKTFAENLAKNYTAGVFGHYYHWTGRDNVKGEMLAEVKDAHLIITDLGYAEGGSDPEVIAEVDGVISVYYVEEGQGSAPYFYMIKTDGGVARIDIAEDGERVIEEVEGYGDIVSVFWGSDLHVYLVDIEGNLYKVMR